MSDLSAEAIAAALTTRRLGRPVLYFRRTGSTNDVAHERAAAGTAEGLLVIADEQTAGRGRLDRRWWAPPGSSLLMSLLLRPSLPPSQVGQLTMCLGLAAVEAIEAVTGLRPALKWPNDLLLNGRKLGGMLSELRLDGEQVAYAVLGLGINVNVNFDDGRWMMDDGRWSMVNGRSSGLADTAMSLSMVLGHPVDRARAAGCALGALRGVVRTGVGGRDTARGLGRPAGHDGAPGHSGNRDRQRGREGRRCDARGGVAGARR